MAKAAASPKTPKGSAGPALQMTKFTPGSAKAALDAAGATVVGQIRMIPIDKLHTMPGFNARVTTSPSYQEHLQTLKRSIMSEGFYSTQPIAGIAGKLEDGSDVVFVTNGHTRLAAAKLAIEDGMELAGLPVILKDKSTTIQQLTVALKKENEGEKIPVLGLAAIVQRMLKEDGADKKTVADSLNISERYVEQLHQLLDKKNSYIVSVVKAEKITGTEAIRLLTANKDTAEEKIKKMIAKAEAEAEAKGQSKEKARATKKHDEDAPTKGRKASSAPADKDADEDEGTSVDNVRMAVDTSRHALKAGQTFAMKELRGFASFMPDNDWFDLIEDKPGWATATEDVAWALTITRPKKDAPPVAGPEDEEEEDESEEESEEDGEAEEEAEAEESAAVKDTVPGELVHADDL